MYRLPRCFNIHFLTFEHSVFVKLAVTPCWRHAYSVFWIDHTNIAIAKQIARLTLQTTIQKHVYVNHNIVEGNTLQKYPCRNTLQFILASSDP